MIFKHFHAELRRLKVHIRHHLNKVRSNSLIQTKNDSGSFTTLRTQTQISTETLISMEPEPESDIESHIDGLSNFSDSIDPRSIETYDVSHLIDVNDTSKLEKSLFKEDLQNEYDIDKEKNNYDTKSDYFFITDSPIPISSKYNKSVIPVNNETLNGINYGFIEPLKHYLSTNGSRPSRSSSQPSNKGVNMSKLNSTIAAKTAASLQINNLKNDGGPDPPVAIGDSSYRFINKRKNKSHNYRQIKYSLRDSVNENHGGKCEWKDKNIDLNINKNSCIKSITGEGTKGLNMGLGQSYELSHTTKEVWKRNNPWYSSSNCSTKVDMLIDELETQVSENHYQVNKENQLIMIPTKQKSTSNIKSRSAPLVVKKSSINTTDTGEIIYQRNKENRNPDSSYSSSLTTDNKLPSQYAFSINSNQDTPPLKLSLRQININSNF